MRDDVGVRLEGKVAVVVGAGQTPGETIGNGRATSITFAREGARVVLVDRRGDSAKDTQGMLEGESVVVQADVTKPEDCAEIVKAAVDAYGRIDILHNNVGIGAGDGNIANVTDEAWHRIIDVNLTGMFNTCKAVLPVMRDQGAGAIVNISSVASVCSVPLLAYKVSKAGVNALTQQLAMANARYGVRVNAILPGLMDTPMAVDAMVRATGTDRADYAAFRDAQVPLLGKQGTAWDVANAALFLASDEAKFITGVLLPVDGGQSAKIG
jgi:NAD(P)-dependent dehydrogenase (short-subunit alcohol dehydrogenase family)